MTGSLVKVCFAKEILFFLRNKSLFSMLSTYYYVKRATGIELDGRAQLNHKSDGLKLEFSCGCSF